MANEKPIFNKKVSEEYHTIKSNNAAESFAINEEKKSLLKLNQFGNMLSQYLNTNLKKYLKKKEW